MAARPWFMAATARICRFIDIESGNWFPTFYSKIRLNIMVCKPSLLKGAAKGWFCGTRILPSELDIFISGDSLKYSK